MPSIYVASIWAKPGEEEAVSDQYRKMAELLKTVDGYKGGHMLRARNGAFIDAVRKVRDLPANNPEEEHGPEGTNFVIVEIWESDEARAKLSSVPGYAPIHQATVPHLLPQHTHEFYEEFVGH
jgi:heme-degrading monooxygenase HmoA